MVERKMSALIAALAVLLVLAVLWDAFFTPAPRRRAGASAAGGARAESVAPAPQPRGDSASSPAVAPAAAPQSSNGPSYMDQLAHAETRRLLRASAGYTYLGEVVAESEDSALHRWDDRATRRVRVYLPTGTAANFQPTFLDAVRQAFGEWEETRIPVRFNTEADSEQAEVRFHWRVQFDIDRTGQTDLTWDQDGRIQSGVVTIATFDPKGRPLSPDDIRVVALHEIGHLIGLDHSADSNDIMFPNTRVRELSQRDIHSAEMLYRLAPGSVR